jgi:maleylacetate reductase
VVSGAVPRGFTYESRAQFVEFCDDWRMSLGSALPRLGCGRLAVLTGERLAPLGAEALELLGDAGALLYSSAIEHTPVEVTDAAEAELNDAGVDGLVAIGGGASIGLAKALAVRESWPILALPSTFAGSEMTTVLGERREGVKATRRDDKALPSVVIYDPALASTMPPELAVASGMNALAHSLEALWAPDSNPLTDAVALESVRLLMDNLDTVASPEGEQRREAVARCLVGAFLAGQSLAATTMGLHHRLCHLLGGMCGLPHAPTHAVLLPHVTALYLAELPDLAARLARATDVGGRGDFAEALGELTWRLGISPGLGALGMERRDLDKVSALALQPPGRDPIELDEATILALLDRAFG